VRSRTTTRSSYYIQSASAGDIYCNIWSTPPLIFNVHSFIHSHTSSLLNSLNLISTQTIMDSKRIIESSSSSSPLLFRGNAESHSQRYDSSDDVPSNHEQHKLKITPSSSSSSSSPTLTFTTLVAVFGSYVFGTAVSFFHHFLSIFFITILNNNIIAHLTDRIFISYSS